VSPFTWRRQAARVVLLDREDRVLLIRASDPANRQKGHWWEIPGGGIEGGEPSEHAARRELYEETGLSEVEMGPCVWRQHVTFEFAGIRFDQDEWVHVARCDGGEYRPAHLEHFEAEAFDGAKWWEQPELAVLDGTLGNRVLPPWLPTQLPAVLAGLSSGGGWPAEPIDLGHVG
jgi:8-oxo-dGTP pyrophosphatase MutT (NUDIX family)